MESQARLTRRRRHCRVSDWHVYERYERKTSTKGEPYFVLKAANNQVIGQSEMYSSPSAMEAGIASVMKNAPGADTVDLA